MNKIKKVLFVMSSEKVRFEINWNAALFNILQNIIFGLKPNMPNRNLWPINDMTLRSSSDKLSRISQKEAFSS